LVLLAAFVAFIVFVFAGVLKQSDPYKNAVARAKADSRVTSALGTPISEGWFVSGNVHTNLGSGDANLTIHISGPKGKGTITAVATKFSGEWTYSKLEVKIESSGEMIDLAETKGLL
jgi:butyrate kinase